MSPPVRVALIGFTPFEREHIEPALRAPRRRRPAYAVRIDELASCNLAIVDADQDNAVQMVLQQQRMASAVMVGSTPRPGAAAQLPRPIQLPDLLTTLDALVAAAPPMSAEVRKVHETLARLLGRGDGDLPPPAADPAPPAAAEAAAAGWPIIAGPQATPRRGRALLVDGHDTRLHFLSGVLPPLGLALDRVASGSEALQRLQQEAYDYVFLAAGSAAQPDPADDGMDGFHTCRLLQRLPPSQPVGPPPTLVLLLADDSAVGRLRAERAGADAWLAHPWAAEALLKIIDERQRWVEQTPQRG